MIIKKKGKYIVTSKSGRKLGEHDSRIAALRQLRAVEASKEERRK
jgi:hypothetical protein